MESNSLRRWFRDPVFLLALTAGLIAFVVQSGELGTADTQHREQSAHSFWTNEPPVFPNEYPEFGVHGRDGKLQSWYGIGQSLLMLPADVVGSYVERLPIFAGYAGTDPGLDVARAAHVWKFPVRKSRADSVSDQRGGFVAHGGGNFRLGATISRR